MLGLMQGPAELLPVSSSGHLVLVPALLGWPYSRLDADVRKAFEVALHAGAGVALAWLMRDAVIENVRDPAGTVALAAPAAVAALAFEDGIEQRASDPRVAAYAQVGSGLALLLADRRWPRRPATLGVGVAQALALVPGVSRNGATLTAGRLLGLSREEAARMSWRAGLPVIGGAVALKSVRLAQRGLARDLRAPFVVGAAVAFASTLVAAPLARLVKRSWAPLGAYRVALGATALRALTGPSH